jgi:phage terminase Nu1 subunit (DNA packaging protein)
MSAKKQQPPPKPNAAEVETEQLCRLFNLTAARIGQLAKDGVIVKTERNKFDLWKSVRGYIEFLQRKQKGGPENEMGYGEAKLKKMRGEADMIEHKLAIQRGEFVPAYEMDKDGVQIGMAVAAVFSRMADDLAPLCAGRTAGEIKKLVTKYAREKRTELSQYESRVEIPTE